MDDLYIEKSLGASSDTLAVSPQAAKRAQDAKVRKQRAPVDKRNMLTVLIGIAVISIAIFMFASRPELARQLATTLDIFSLSDFKQREEARVHIIMQMRIPHEKKLALIDGKVFVGATMEMVSLSLGKPKKIETTVVDGKQIETWIFQLSGDDYSTAIEFTDKILTKATKAPALVVE